MIPRGSILCVLVALGCSAAGDPPVSGEQPDPNSQDAGQKIKLTDQELCGNDSDDDGDGLVDENCDCNTVPSSGEVPSVGGCHEPDSGQTTPGCVPDGPSETACDDGRDDDCDGNMDCADPECTSQCSCEPVESKCTDGVDDDCDGKLDCTDDDCPKCSPGAVRYCDEPVFCAWGLQTCGPDGRWGACTETQPPAGCEGIFPGFPATYDLDCCLAQGYCCQQYPADTSVGDCAGIAQCP
jgi:hypothetical protein